MSRPCPPPLTPKYRSLGNDYESGENDSGSEEIDSRVAGPKIDSSLIPGKLILIQTGLIMIHIKLIKNNYVLVKTNSKFPDMLYVNQKKFSY